MIHTFAVDPACMDTWEGFRFFLDKFGPGLGRLLLDLPAAGYRAELRKAIAAFPERQQRLAIDRLQQAIHNDRKFCHRPAARYDAGKTWVANALVEHDREPLAAVVAAVGGPRVLAADEVHEDAGPFRVDTTPKVERTPDAMAAAVAPLLRLGGGEVHFVDPYLVREDRHRGVIASDRHLGVLRRMLTLGRVANDVHYHTHGDSRFDFAAEEAVIRRAVPTDDVRFTLWLWPVWPVKSLHNRFVLTARGGVKFGHGLDAGPGRDNLDLLGEASWREEWDKYRAAGRTAGVRRHDVRSERDRRRAVVSGVAGSSLNISLPHRR